MTEPRLHLLARQVASRVSLGHNPEQAALDALVEATNTPMLPPIYDQLPPKARAICRALWGEPPMRAVDVYRLLGGSHRCIQQLLRVLMKAKLVRRPRYAHYAIQFASLMPETVPRLHLLNDRRRQPISPSPTRSLHVAS